MIDLRLAIPPEHPEIQGRYHPRLRALDGRSGVYAIIDRRTRAVLYVGESHSGRLYDTLTRHFREWSIPPGTGRFTGRREGGVQYDRYGVLVAWETLPAARVRAAQAREIARLEPRDNTIGWPEEEVAPF